MMVCMGEAPILRDISMILGLSSRRLLSTRRATKGKAATTSGTMEATVPTAVPTTARVKGNEQDHKDQEGDGTQQIDDDIDGFHQPAGQGGQAALFAHNQDDTQRQTDDHGKEHGRNGDIQRLPEGQQELPLNNGECFLQVPQRKRDYSAYWVTSWAVISPSCVR